MAAGRGSRFGGIKQLEPVGPSGEVLFDYSVYDATRAGFDEVVFVVSDESRAPVEAHAGDGCGRHVKARFALQQVPEGRQKPWGTGQAVLCGAADLDRSFGVVNADDFYGAASFALLAQCLADPSPAHTLVGFRLLDSLSPNGGVSRGLCRTDGAGRLTAITELHDVAAGPGGPGGGGVTNREGVALTGDELISANLWGFRPSFPGVLAAEFQAFRAARDDDPDAEFLIGDAVMIVTCPDREGVRVVPTPEPFLGITYRADVADVRHTIAERVGAGQYPSPLW